MTDALTPNFDALADDAGGMLDIFIVGRDDMPALIWRATKGDIRAGQLIRAAVGSISQVENASWRDPVPCGGCQKPVRPRSRYKIGIGIPSTDRPRQALGFALCWSCIRNEQTADEAAIAAIRDVYPHAKTLTHRHGGRA
jgi:hypothetical protein